MVGTDNLSTAADKGIGVRAFTKTDEALKGFDDNIELQKNQTEGASEISALHLVTAQNALQKQRRRSQ